MADALESAKCSILDELDNVVKLLESEYVDEEIGNLLAQRICNSVEAVFIHGLRDTFFLKGSRYAPHPEPNFFPFVTKFTPNYIKRSMGSQIRTEIGRSRAWVRIILNEGTMEQYINVISKDYAQLNQFYTKPAFLRDCSKVDTFLSRLRVMSKLTINFATNSSILNNWTPSPLMLAGIITGKLTDVSLHGKQRRNVVRDDDSEVGVNALETLPSPLRRASVSNIDDDQNSVLSHPSMVDEWSETDTNQRNILLSSTPEERPVAKFSAYSPDSEVVVRRRRNRMRRSSRSSSGGSSGGMSRNNSQPNNLYQTAFGMEAFEEERSSVVKSSPEQPSSSAYDIVELELPTNITAKSPDNAEEVAELTEEPLILDTPKSEASDLESKESEQTAPHNSIILGNSLEGRNWGSQDWGSSDSPTVGSPAFAPMTLNAALKNYIENRESTDGISSSEPPSRKSSTDCEVLMIAKEMSYEKFTPNKSQESDELSLIDEFGIKRNVLSLLTEIPIELGLDAQNFRCPSCLKSVGGSFSQFRLCNLDARYYCEECFKRGAESIIPSRVLLNWDLRPKPISRPSKNFLKAVSEKAVIRVDEVNPMLYEHAPALARVHQLRVKLSFVAMYLLSCKQSVSDDLKRRIWPNDYHYTDVHRYSLKDLENVVSGVFERRLSTIVDHCVNHVAHCVLCVQKGFICEICSSKKSIYPFQIETTTRCEKCFAVYHKPCLQSAQCPKCERRKRKESAEADSPFA